MPRLVVALECLAHSVSGPKAGKEALDSPVAICQDTNDRIAAFSIGRCMLRGREAGADWNVEEHG